MKPGVASEEPHLLIWGSASKMSRDRIPHYTEVTQCQPSHLAPGMSNAVFIHCGRFTGPADALRQLFEL